MNTNTHTQAFSWSVALLLSLGIGLLAAGLSVFVQTRTDIAYALHANVVQTVTAAVTPTVEGGGSTFNAPVRLIIPAIGVDAYIQSVGLYWRGDGAMGIPTNFTDVAWYNLGPRPGSPGSAVIDGHYDGKDVREAVFYNLGKLQPGDLVEVRYQTGTPVEFRVVASKTYAYDATTTADVFSGDTSAARLNLVTCAGTWDKTQGQYSKRIVVFTELIKPN